LLSSWGGGEAKNAFSDGEMEPETSVTSAEHAKSGVGNWGEKIGGPNEDSLSKIRLFYKPGTLKEKQEGRPRGHRGAEVWGSPNRGNTGSCRRLRAATRAWHKRETTAEETKAQKTTWDQLKFLDRVGTKLKWALTKNATQGRQPGGDLRSKAELDARRKTWGRGTKSRGET